ncbi:peptidoglycan bridge formation glycyltransferase FemA/FemB family protein [Candidatus Uhrbacteria bacterium]|nr:peptidoglycan bridge formation glycyltransferase FemA/FemB family protein [Candidatus Uhrbacteria bacterium]
MLLEIHDANQWNEMVLKNPARSGEFLQSWQWGEFQKAVGRGVYRFLTEEVNTIQVVEHQLPLGRKYWYAPRTAGIKGISDRAKSNQITFVRYEPLGQDQILAGSQPTIQVSPPATLMVDLTKSEDDLLAAMHEKTRYNIRLAGRKNIEVSKSQSLGDFEFFWALLEETAGRDGFRPHPKWYYQKMLKILSTSQPTANRQPPTANCFVQLWTAEWEGKILAAGLWIYFGDTVTYLHGASASEHREVMAPYALHWQVMAEAKSRGYHYYDWWGIKSNTSNHSRPTIHLSWDGLTRFKLGFGGETVEFPGTFDLPISKFWYSLYRLGRRLRRNL